MVEHSYRVRSEDRNLGTTGEFETRDMAHYDYEEGRTQLLQVKIESDDDLITAPFLETTETSTLTLQVNDNAQSGGSQVVFDVERKNRRKLFNVEPMTRKDSKGNTLLVGWKREPIVAMSVANEGIMMTTVPRTSSAIDVAGTTALLDAITTVNITIPPGTYETRKDLYDVINAAISATGIGLQVDFRYNTLNGWYSFLSSQILAPYTSDNLFYLYDKPDSPFSLIREVFGCYRSCVCISADPSLCTLSNPDLFVPIDKDIVYEPEDPPGFGISYDSFITNAYKRPSTGVVIQVSNTASGIHTDSFLSINGYLAALAADSHTSALLFDETDDGRYCLTINKAQMEAGNPSGSAAFSDLVMTNLVMSGGASLAFDGIYPVNDRLGYYNGARIITDSSSAYYLTNYIINPIPQVGDYVERFPEPDRWHTVWGGTLPTETLDTYNGYPPNPVAPHPSQVVRIPPTSVKNMRLKKPVIFKVNRSSRRKGRAIINDPDDLENTQPDYIYITLQNQGKRLVLSNGFSATFEVPKSPETDADGRAIYQFIDNEFYSQYSWVDTAHDDSRFVVTVTNDRGDIITNLSDWSFLLRAY